jgi:hypothetical protein
MASALAADVPKGVRMRMRKIGSERQRNYIDFLMLHNHNGLTLVMSLVVVLTEKNETNPLRQN